MKNRDTKTIYKEILQAGLLPPPVTIGTFIGKVYSSSKDLRPHLDVLVKARCLSVKIEDDFSAVYQTTEKGKQLIAMIEELESFGVSAIKKKEVDTVG